MMKSFLFSKSLLYCLSVLFVFSISNASQVQAEEDVSGFLKALRDKGHGELGITYLEMLEKNGKIPDHLKVTIELEKSHCYRAAAKSAYDPAQAQRLIGLAQKHLETFLKNNPNHPAVAEAALADADSQFEIALKKFSGALGMTDGPEKKQQLEASRMLLDNCRQRFVDASKRIKGLRAALPPLQKLPENRKPTAAEVQERELRARIEVSYVECRLKEALTIFQIAHTHEAKSKEQIASLKDASKKFNEIYREYGSNTEVGLQAHLWKGRSLAELGDLETAADIYDEVQVLEPEDSRGNEGNAPFYSEVELLRIQLMIVRGREAEAKEDAAEWLTSHKYWSKTPKYQGVALEYAKLILAEADKAKTDERAKLVKEANAILVEIAKVESEYKADALLLRRGTGKNIDRDPVNIDEALAIGEEAITSKNWDGAKKAFNQALGFANQTSDKDKVANAKTRLNQIQYQIARDLYKDGKAAEALKQALIVMQLGKEDPTAPVGAGLALQISYEIHRTATDKAEPFKEFDRIARAIIGTWPSRPEADEARVMLAQFHNEKGEVAEAHKLYQQVNPNSKRYPIAQMIIGQSLWKQSQELKKLPPDQQKPDEIIATRDRAATHFLNAIKALRLIAVSGQPLDQQLVNASLIYIQIQMEAEKSAEAIQAVEPLIENIRKFKPKKIDTAVLRVAYFAVKNYLSVGRTDDAANIADFLVELGPDGQEVNSVLVDFAKLIGGEVRAAKTAHEDALAQNDLQNTPITNEKYLRVKKVYEDYVEKLLKREDYSVIGLVYLADTSAQFGKTDEARGLYQKIIDKSDSDPKFQAAAERYITRVRVQLVGLLRDEGKFEEAVKQMDQLIAKHPNSLEPKVEKAKILQAWAKKDSKHYDESISLWTTVQLSLAKQKSPEYFDAVYNVGECLVEQSLAIKDPTKATTAYKLVYSIMSRYPKLDGEETVAKYKVLLKRAAAAEAKK